MAIPVIGTATQRQANDENNNNRATSSLEEATAAAPGTSQEASSSTGGEAVDTTEPAVESSTPSSSSTLVATILRRNKPTSNSSINNNDVSTEASDMATGDEECGANDDGGAVDNDNDEDNDNDDASDDMTVIILDQSAVYDEMMNITPSSLFHPNNVNNNNMPSVAFIPWLDDPEMQARRRVILLRELSHIQRSSFFHFLLLCLIPTALLFIVIATVVGDEEECISDATTCTLEPRTFINAFTTRCICAAVQVAKNVDNSSGGVTFPSYQSFP